jgi:hypothetical protein
MEMRTFRLLTARSVDVCFISHKDIGIVKENSDGTLSYLAKVCHVAIA